MRTTSNANYSGKWGLVLLVGLWTTVVWIGSDMYLPALPLMDEALGASEGLVNATLLAFNMAGPIGSVLGGPLSDKMGRFAPTLAGGIAFVLGNVACALSSSVGALIVFRALSGLGGGVCIATIMAILKDCLDGNELETAVTATQSLAIVGPIVAPFLGSLMIGLIGWRGIFWLIALMGAVLLVAYVRLGETLPADRRVNVGVLGSLGLIVGICKNRPFVVLLIALSMPALCFGVFVTACSYVYIDEFGLSYLEYSFMYAATSVVSIVAPFIYVALQRRIGDRNVIWACAAMLMVAGAWLLAVGWQGAAPFVLGTLLFACAEGMARPCAYLVLLRAESEHAGSASALINLSIGAFYALGTPFASLPWPNHVAAVGAPTLLAGFASAVLFGALVFGMKSRIVDE